MLAFLLFLFRFPSLALHPTAAPLTVPYVSQVPDGQWVLPWSQACEEASIAMVEGFYHGKTKLDVADTKARMQQFITWENETFKLNEDTDAEQTKELIASQSGFSARVVRDPSLEGIKNELAAKRPVIALINMYKFYHEPSQGDSYHVLVITGFDEEKKEFIVNDPARERQRYSYSDMMSALHDFNATSHEADAAPTVLYTRRSIFKWFSR